MSKITKTMKIFLDQYNFDFKTYPNNMYDIFIEHFNLDKKRFVVNCDNSLILCNLITMLLFENSNTEIRSYHPFCRDYTYKNFVCDIENKKEIIENQWDTYFFYYIFDGIHIYNLLKHYYDNYDIDEVIDICLDNSDIKNFIVTYLYKNINYINIVELEIIYNIVNMLFTNKYLIIDKNTFKKPFVDNVVEYLSSLNFINVEIKYDNILISLNLKFFRSFINIVNDKRKFEILKLLKNYNKINSTDYFIL